MKLRTNGKRIAKSSKPPKNLRMASEMFCTHEEDEELYEDELELEEHELIDSFGRIHVSRVKGSALPRSMASSSSRSEFLFLTALCEPLKSKARLSHRCPSKHHMRRTRACTSDSIALVYLAARLQVVVDGSVASL